MRVSPSTAQSSHVEAAPAAPAGVAARLLAVRRRIADLATEFSRANTPRLVAVSKTKDAATVREAYDAGQRVFGENYVTELVDKARLLPEDCQWHFIGHLQSNKARLLCSVRNLACVECVDSAKVATALDRAWGSCDRAQRLRVFVQVNSSGEDSKFGVAPDGVGNVARHVRDACPNLELVGLMTIGALDYSPNPACFERMATCRRMLAAELDVPEHSLELSMGMSADYETAIRMGSTSVRVGSTIFGKRA